ncbi:MAG: oxidoreductase [bacterium]|nr:oxidoreductase [bacterium]
MILTLRRVYIKMVANKTIALIGAAGLLGKELVNSLILAGANVIAVDINEEAIAKLREHYIHHPNIVFLSGDISYIPFLESVFDKALSVFGGLDGAVNTTYPKNKNYGRSFEDVTYSDFCENLSLHVGGYFLFMQQAVKFSLKNSTEFSLVNLSSIYGSKAPRFEVYEGTKITMPVEYAAIKSAINHLTEYVTAYTKKTLFRVNCVSPGGILANQDPVFLEAYNKHCNQKGLLEPADVIPTILFLLSKESKYVLGQNIIVDDGFCI